MVGGGAVLHRVISMRVILLNQCTLAANGYAAVNYTSSNCSDSSTVTDKRYVRPVRTYVTFILSLVEAAYHTVYCYLHWQFKSGTLSKYNREGKDTFYKRSTIHTHTHNLSLSLSLAASPLPYLKSFNSSFSLPPRSHSFSWPIISWTAATA